MGQAEIMKFLKDKRKKSDDWFSVPEIKEGLKSEGYTNGELKNIHNQLYKLTMFNLIQCEGVGMWKHKKLFRGKKR